LTHRSGLPRHDNAWYGRSVTRKELYQRLRYLEPSTTFRNRYQYQNLMFMTAGYLAEQLTGRSWDDLIRERIFTPLGMSRSNTSVTESPRSDDFAYPYAWRDSALVRIPFRNIDAIGPAGSINSSVEEMLKYIQLRIDQGAVGGKQVVSRRFEQQAQSPQMVSAGGGGGQDSEELGLGTYGLGLSVSTYRGRRTVAHGGGIDGFISAMTWLPREKIGVMVLTNFGGNNPVPTLVTRNVMDRFLGLEQVDWVGRTRKQQEEGRARQEQRNKERAAERKAGTSPSHELAAYAGTYEHPGYGRVTVRQAGADLEVALDGFAAQLSHFHYDVFEAADTPQSGPLQGRVAFLTNKQGVVDRVAIPLEPAVADIVFTRTR
jgi:CubicO group peptidase (beta-lactamase class C family)